MRDKKEQMIFGVAVLYLLCFVFRLGEYFVLRTDQTVLGEAFVHKLMGIGILFAAVKYGRLQWGEIGFTRDRIWHDLRNGLAFGLLVFIPAYAAEIIMVQAQGGLKAISLYVSAYSVEGTIGSQTGPLFFALCIAGNGINVIMEEGIFRGLFQRMLEKRFSFLVSAGIASGLFGLWHIVAPARSCYDGSISYQGFLASAVLLVVTSSLVGFKFALMTRLANGLYLAMGDHFVNNTIVNLLHVVSGTGADELMVVRVTIAQTVSFVIVLLCYLRAQRKAILS